MLDGVNPKRSFHATALGMLAVLVALAVIGAVGLAWRSATVSNLYGLRFEQTIISTTNKIGLVRRTIAFEPDASRFERTRKIDRFVFKNFPQLTLLVARHFPTLRWRIGVGSKALQLDDHEMQWSTGGYLYAPEPGIVNSKWEFVHWTGTNFDELTADMVRQSFGNGPRGSETSTIMAGQIVFARPSTQPGTIYVLKVQASQMNRAIVDYVSVPSRRAWPVSSYADSASAACLANLRKLGAFAGMYAEANGGILPSNFTQLRGLSPDYLGLECSGKLPDGTTIDFGSLEHESSYVIIAPGMDARKPENLGKVYAGCLKHGFVCLNDGSANCCREPGEEFMNQYLALLGRPSSTNSPTK